MASSLSKSCSIGHVTVAALQMKCTSNPLENISKAERLVRDAANAGAEVILIQELFDRPYFCIDQMSSHFDLAKEANESNPLLLRFSNLAKELNIVLPISFFEKSAGSFFNSMAMIDCDGTILGVYRKSHVPDGPGYTEKFYFSPGDTGFKVWKTKKCRIGCGICWDQWNPECARIMTLMGAEIICYPTAIGSEPQDPTLDSRGHWRRVMQGHAGANVIPVFASNRIGTEKSLLNPSTSITFYGTSFISDETGNIVADCDSETEGFITHCFDLKTIAQTRASWGVFRDRRPDLYGCLLSLDGMTPGVNTMAVNMPKVQHSVSSDVKRLKTTSLPPYKKETPCYQMPAEWSPHAGTWMGFPTSKATWYGGAQPAQERFVSLARCIANFEPVTMVVPGNLYSKAVSLFGGIGDGGGDGTKHGVRLLEMSSNDGSWLRDQAPTFVVDRNGVSGVSGVCWKFDAWGKACYDDFSLDALMSQKICATERLACFTPDMVLEGGSVHVDGEGTLLTTEECLLNANIKGNKRNPTLMKAEIEAKLKRYLGVSKVLWLPFGMVGDDDTAGHVDNMCCFLRPGVVLLHWCEKAENAEQYERCEAALSYLAAQTDALGRPIQVIKMPSPSPLYLTAEECDGLEEEEGGCGFEREVGSKLPASYINFYICNGAVIVPQFGGGSSERDKVALDLIKKEFPERTVIGFSSRVILCGGGNIHCTTMQQPISY